MPSSLRRTALALLCALAPALACGSADEVDEAEAAGRAPAPAAEDAADDYLAAEDEPAAEPSEPELPASQLPFTALATIAAADPARCSATLRDDGDGTILTLHTGDSLGDDARIEAIERGRIVIRRGDRLEALALPRAAVRLDDPLASWSEEPDADDPGVLVRGVQLGPGSHYAIKTPNHAWGERAVVQGIQRAITLYSRRARGGPKIHVGDLSLRGGGHFPPHLSHRSGRDVDVGYVLKGPQADDLRFRDADRNNLDVARTWALLESFIAAGPVRIIFVDYRIQRLLYDHAREAGVDEDRLAALLQYPRGEHFPGGVIRHFRGHRNHFHARYGPALAGASAAATPTPTPTPSATPPAGDDDDEG
ncbi:MAG: penicillin-insensitive murein endopeptidase [Myxococcales bacterium]|nr:penicillin-insensitive murein endopeptidase [Myxococcales bacterium]MCB9703929.1 penicillin-insensitive murein endopeptidase [Myxococcales bacterium]